MAKREVGADPADYLPLSHEQYHMLLALTDGRELHGYGIKLEVKERTKGAINLDVGKTYAHVKKLLQAGMIAEADAPADEEDTRRRYYKLTDFGQKVISAEVQRLSELVKFGRAKGYPKLKEA
jgi:DNA-binding PadR family transcriptional regulator